MQSVTSYRRQVYKIVQKNPISKVKQHTHATRRWSKYEILLGNSIAIDRHGPSRLRPLRHALLHLEVQRPNFVAFPVPLLPWIG